MRQRDSLEQTGRPTKDEEKAVLDAQGLSQKEFGVVVINSAEEPRRTFADVQRGAQEEINDYLIAKALEGLYEWPPKTN